MRGVSGIERQMWRWPGGHVARAVGRALVFIGVSYAALLMGLAAVNLLLPQRNGLLALTQILAFLLFVPLLLFVPVAVVRLDSRSRAAQRALRLLLVACAIVALVRFAPAWIPAAPAAVSGGVEIGATAWNLEGDAPSPSAVVAALHDAAIGIVSLEELGGAASAAIETDPDLLRRFPYRVLAPRDDSLGIGLLSSYPFIGTPSVRLDPPLIHARLALDGGRALDAIAAHPQPARLETVGLFPSGFDPSIRDAEIATIRSIVNPLIASDGPLLLLGDFNTTDAEPVYRDLTAGLVDLQRAVGWGPGWTWRIDAVKWLPFGLLRIDIVLAGPGVAPVRISPDCTPRGSDHCIVRASVALP
jgi:vancomycin resistance protein VanJ